MPCSHWAALPLICNLIRSYSPSSTWLQYRSNVVQLRRHICHPSQDGQLMKKLPLLLAPRHLFESR